MNRPELYHRTVGILYTAYFNDTLVHGTCCACAVGNLIAARLGYSIRKEQVPYFGILEITEHHWYDVNGKRVPDPILNSMSSLPAQGWGAFVCTPNPGRPQEIEWKYLSELVVQQQIAATGYTPEEVILIERVFESAKGETIEDRMFDGLCRVLDALEAIHEVHHQETIDQKKHFSEHYQIRVYAGTASISDR
jgi:hypothetical protein